MTFWGVFYIESQQTGITSNCAWCARLSSVVSGDMLRYAKNESHLADLTHLP